MPTILSIRNITKSFESLLAVDDVSFDVQQGEFFSLLGPSGCGKTTLLRMLGGFESPSSGKILIKEIDVTSHAPQKRPTSMVFQNYALFPHMTIGGNIEYGLKVKKLDKTTRAKKVDELLELVNLEGLSKKPVVELSGGQQQRVALARAVAVEPQILLFDEPLSNLDAALRESTRKEIKRLQRDLGITSIYVTHDQEEALSLSDRIAVMKDGKVVELDSPRELYSAPKSSFVASFVGAGNLIHNQELARELASELRDGFVLSFKPEDVHISQDDEGVEFSLEGHHFLGRHLELWLNHRDSGTAVRALVDPGFQISDQVKIGLSKYVWVK